MVWAEWRGLLIQAESQQGSCRRVSQKQALVEGGVRIVNLQPNNLQVPSHPVRVGDLRRDFKGWIFKVGGC